MQTLQWIIVWVGWLPWMGMSRGFEGLDRALASGRHKGGKVSTRIASAELPIPPLSAAIVLRPVNEVVGPTNTVENRGESF